MDQPQPMPVERFLMLLNKADRTPEEQQELDAEVLRQAQANQPAQPVSDAPATPEAPTQEQVETPAQEVQAQPEQPVTATPEVQTEDVPYSLEQLAKELTDASAFLRQQGNSVAIEMGVCSLETARYWINLAQSGK